MPTEATFSFKFRIEKGTKVPLDEKTLLEVEREFREAMRDGPPKRVDESLLDEAVEVLCLLIYRLDNKTLQKRTQLETSLSAKMTDVLPLLVSQSATLRGRRNVLRGQLFLAEDEQLDGWKELAARKCGRKSLFQLATRRERLLLVFDCPGWMEFPGAEEDRWTVQVDQDCFL